MSSTRRSFLNRLALGAGLPVLSPILSQLEYQAAAAHGAAVKLPQRFVFVAVSSGIMPEEVTPPALASVGEDKFLNVPLANQELLSDMEPLASLKDYLSIIQGVSGKMCAGGHTSNYGALGAWRAPGEKGAPPPKRATVDSMLSKLYPAAVPHLATSLTGGWGSRITEGVVYPDISAAGPQKTIPFQASPDIVFEQLFGTVASNDRYNSRKLASKRNLLDFMSDDVRKIQKALPSEEKAKLDHYLDALEGLQDQDVKIAALRQSLEKNVPEFTDKYTAAEPELRQEAHFELIAAALISGITKVATMKIDSSSTIYRGLGVSEKSVHGIGHNESSNGKTGLECRALIRRHHFEILARLANKLKAVPEGEGNMLDNTMIVYISPAGDRHHGLMNSWPMVVLGGCGGRLKLPGRYLQFPGYGQTGHKTIGNWWTSVLNAFGNPVDHYGDFDPGLMKGGFDQKGPIAGIIG